MEKKPQLKNIAILFLIILGLWGLYCFIHFAYVASKEKPEDEMIEDSYAYIDELNENSNFGMELNSDCGLTEEEASQYGGDYPYTMQLDHKETEYYCFRYPDQSAPMTVTQIQVLDPEYHVFGIKLGDSIEASDDILCGYGYEEKDYPIDTAIKYAKGDLNVILYHDENNRINRIVVSISHD